MSKDIQWQYQTGSNEWKNFPIYTNSLIETNYSKGQQIVNLFFSDRLKTKKLIKAYPHLKKVKFDNEENEKSTIHLNINPMIYSYSGKNYYARRLDTTKCSFTFIINYYLI